MLEAVLERLQDFEDKVRSRAIIAICEAATTFPEVSLPGMPWSSIALEPAAKLACILTLALLHPAPGGCMTFAALGRSHSGGMHARQASLSMLTLNSLVEPSSSNATAVM